MSPERAAWSLVPIATGGASENIITWINVPFFPTTRISSGGDNVKPEKDVSLKALCHAGRKELFFATCDTERGAPAHSADTSHWMRVKAKGTSENIVCPKLGCNWNPWEASGNYLCLGGGAWKSGVVGRSPFAEATGLGTRAPMTVWSLDLQPRSSSCAPLL